MKAEELISVFDRLKKDVDGIRAVIICRNTDAEMVGNEFCAEMVCGQVHRLLFEMQFATMIQDEEPKYLTDKIHADLDKLANGH